MYEITSSLVAMRLRRIVQCLAAGIPNSLGNHCLVLVCLSILISKASKVIEAKQGWMGGCAVCDGWMRN
ncbi:uncharacterized protein BJX67DRAFT_366512 [Aspergillus lucknowensis]|uniref:Uncharacterized protein n=1 Tax=Aspergillus lucknowensis TaxID=176173 RepID=A0ABR4LCU4_9EURO